MRIKTFGIVVAAVGITLAGCSANDETVEVQETTIDTANGPIVEQEAVEVPDSGPVSAPDMIGFGLTDAEQDADFNVKAQDVGEFVVDNVDGKRDVIDSNDWTIVTQCSDVKDDKLNVGVIKNDEYNDAIEADAEVFADNALSNEIDCPTS